MALIYKVTNLINNKVYIGMTVRSAEERFKGHLSSARNGSNFRFHSAIRKYGVDNFVVEVIETSDDIEYIRSREAELIEEHKTTLKQFGYNARKGGCGGWIVPVEKYESWKSKQDRQKGAHNGNFSGLTNEELFELVRDLSIVLGRVPGLKTVRKYHPEVPKSFSIYRFGGSYPNLARMIANETGLIYDPYFRSTEQRLQIRDTLAETRSRVHTDDIGGIFTC
jgi:group I intron endonuclease